MFLDVESLYNRRNIERFHRISVGDILERLTSSYPHREAIVATEGAYSHQRYQRMTYQQADQLANQVAHQLLASGLQKGDRVLQMNDNSTEAYLFKIGVAKAGLVNVPVNTMVSEDVIKHIVNLTQPSFITVDSEYYEKLKAVTEKLDYTIDMIIPIGGSLNSGSIIEFDRWISPASTKPLEVEIHGDDIWEILFTSGTTSLPKGAMISHHYTYFSAYNYALKLSRGVEFTKNFKVLSLLPVIYHVTDQTLPTAAFLMGGTIVLGRKHNVSNILRDCTDENPTSLWAGSSVSLNEVVEQYDANPDKYNLTSLTTIIYGYSALDPEVHDQLKEICQGVGIFASFAQTEAISGHRFWHDEYPETYYKHAPIKNYVGLADPSLEAAVIKEDGELSYKPGDSGEVVYRGLSLFSGYYKNKEATQSAFYKGWFMSGDNVGVDKNGLTYMLDRSKDIIKSKGESVNSTRVEGVLNQHPKVRVSAVIGVPDKIWGERVTGIVELKEGETIDEAELINYVRRQIAGFETPKRIYFEDHLPESIGGKIKKSLLREKYSQN